MYQIMTHHVVSPAQMAFISEYQLRSESAAQLGLSETPLVGVIFPTSGSEILNMLKFFDFYNPEGHELSYFSSTASMSQIFALISPLLV